MKLSRLALIAALGAGALALGNSGADARGSSGRHMGQFNGNFQPNYGHRYGYNGWRGNRCFAYANNCRHYYRGYYYPTVWWTVPLVVGGVAASSAAYGNSHIAWCSSRYRSYNPRTNLWLGNSGRYYQCVSGY